MRRPTPPRVYGPRGGRPPKRGDEFIGSSETWGADSADGLEYQVDGRDPVAWRDRAGPAPDSERRAMTCALGLTATWWT